MSNNFKLLFASLQLANGKELARLKLTLNLEGEPPRPTSSVPRAHKAGPKVITTRCKKLLGVALTSGNWRLELRQRQRQRLGLRLRLVPLNESDRPFVIGIGRVR